MRSHRRKNVQVVAALAVAFIVGAWSGCSGNEGAEADIYGSPVDMNNLNDDEFNTVQVSLVEYEIDMPATVSAGPTKFVVKNEGQAKHNFKIEGQGMERVLAEEDLQPGEQGELRVDLKPGKYTVYCPVFNHRDRGMERTLTTTAQG